MFRTDHHPVIGAPVEIENDILVVTAPNAGPMTFTGTQSYILGSEDVAVIDPGPASPDHESALMRAIDGREVGAILVTHAHLDHSPQAARLAHLTGAKIHACAPAMRTQNRFSQSLKGIGGGEGVDAHFRPDVELQDGDMVAGKSWQIEAVFTPGHLNDHMCFATGDTLFSGDHVMGWATTMISPPEGDLTDFMASLQKLLSRNENRYLPGHGGPVDDGIAIVRHLIEHRRGREAQILDVLDGVTLGVKDLTQKIYVDVDPKLHGAASRNVLAHLIDLVTRKKVVCLDDFDLESQFRAVSNKR